MTLTRRHYLGSATLQASWPLENISITNCPWGPCNDKWQYTVGNLCYDFHFLAMILIKQLTLCLSASSSLEILILGAMRPYNVQYWS